MAVHKKINKDFFKKWTSEMAYILGFFAADGCITVNRRGGQYWCFKITDKKLLEQIKKSIKSDHKISIRLGKGNIQTIHRLQIGSIEMCNDLRKLGFGERKAKCLVVPNIPEKYFHHFIRGYFDGDGNVWSGVLNRTRSKPTSVICTVFTSCSIDFLKNIKNLLQTLGIQGGSLFKIKDKNCGRLNYSTLDTLKLYKIMYNSPGKLYLRRKKLVFDRFIKMRA